MIFGLFPKSLYYILLYLKWRELLHYLNNFWSIYPNLLAKIAYANKFNLICLDLSFSIQAKKDKIGTIINFLEIKLDTIVIEAKLFFKKLQRAITLVDKPIAKLILLWKVYSP